VVYARPPSFLPLGMVPSTTHFMILVEIPLFIFAPYITKKREPGSSVGIATGYGLHGPGIESRWGRDFPHVSRPANISFRYFPQTAGSFRKECVISYGELTRSCGFHSGVPSRSRSLNRRFFRHPLGRVFQNIILQSFFNCFF
jgi:hypothetical protein